MTEKRDIWWARRFCDDFSVDSRTRDRMSERLADIFAADQTERDRDLKDAIEGERERCADLVMDCAALGEEEAEELSEAIRRPPLVTAGK